MSRPSLKWTRVIEHLHRAVAPSGRAYEISLAGRSLGHNEWLLVAFPNEDTQYGDAVTYGTFIGLKARAVEEEQRALREDGEA